MNLNIRFYFLLSLALIASIGLSAQTQWTLERNLNWSNVPKQIATPNGTNEVWLFEGCSTADKYGHLPVYGERIALPSKGIASVQIIGEQFVSFSKNADADNALIPSDLVPEYWVEQERNAYYLRVLLLPIRKSGAGLERLEKFNLQVNFTPTATGATTDRGGPHTYTSALADGAIYKFGVTKTGMYKLDYNYLKNDLKISNLDNIDPKSIRIYGNGGKALPQKAGAARADDLVENAIMVIGESDGKFDQSDYIIMYGEGPMTFTYQPSSSSTKINGETNIYSKEAYYFVKIGGGSGLRVPEQASIDSGGVPTSEFDDIVRLEEDKVNLLDFYTLTQGSGQMWFGDYFNQSRTKNYSAQFQFPNAVVGAKGLARAAFAGRSSVSTTVRLTVADNPISRNLSTVNVSDNESTYARLTSLDGEFTVLGDKPNVVLDYVQASQASEGWIDFIELQVRRKLILTSGAMTFRDLNSLNQPVTEFNLSGAPGSGLFIWDITERLLPRSQKYTLTGGTAKFGANTSADLKTFIAFTATDAVKPDVAIGPIANQNIHAHDHFDLAIIYHQDFKAQAEQLAQHRRSYSGLEVVLVDVMELYNEFAAGKKDPSAIRDYAKMLYERDNKFKYLLLFGDGSFDTRGISDAPKTDFIPVFETPESFNPISAHPSDDFFGLLSDDEGAELRGALEIAIGRFPVNTPEEAAAVVNKVIAYDNNPISLGDWHNRMLYLADDEDQNVHLDQAENLQIKTKARLSYMNFEKVYLDAYQQVATSGGQFYPDAKKAFNADMFKGNLIVTYIGHGGPRGWTQERVIDNNDIALWANEHRCPLIISATCSFGGYDNPRFVSGGEQSLIKPKSGAMGLFTTVRAVYISGNNELTNSVENVIFEKANSKYRTIGDVLAISKNQLNGGEENARRFTLLGDPAQLLALPEYRVFTTSINGKAFDPNQPDTISALEPVTLTAEVRDTFGNLLSTFNGRAFITVFDKPQILQTLGQDPGSRVVPFTVQRSIIFRGAATVTAGKFSVSFIVPKDINYTPGQGKISYYAENGTPLDAAGSDSGFLVGGISNAIKDDQPPVVQVFMNDDKFVTGGVTDANPRIYARISDDYGINISGTSIGHDLTGVVDANVQETLVLNDFFQSNLDNAKAGVLAYPLSNLEPGLHKVVVKAWDIANNKGEGFTEFLVASDAGAALDHVLNYPNPFTTSTAFQFEHNMPGQVLEVQVRIFSVSGKLVKTILHQSNPEGYRITDVVWDGKDDFGDTIGKGVYVYKVSVRGTDLAGISRTAESKFEKLVILK